MNWKQPVRLLIFALCVVLVIASALVVYVMWMPGKSYEGPLPDLSEDQQRLAERLRGHVEVLAGEIGPRYYGRPESYEEAGDYIVEQFEEAGYEVNIRRFEHQGQTFRNIEVEVAGAGRADEIVVVGAHYDTAGRTPGADDNASGVAGTLEIARRMAEATPARTVRFVAFANEEAPFFHTDGMGSRVYARRAKERGEQIVAMLSLEMLGYYCDEPGCQEYPLFLDKFYPERGDFIAFVSDLGSRDALTESLAAFREHAQFPSEGLTAPALVPGVSLSDHWAFWQEGYPAVMVTDTAFYRNPHYHQKSDTPATLDYERFARVVDGLERAITTLSSDD